MRLHLVLATVALALAFAPRARAQSALDQLKAACAQGGGNCSPNVPDVPEPTRVDDDRADRAAAKAAAAAAARANARPPALTTEQLVRAQLTGALLQGLFASIFDGASSTAADQAAAAERQRQEAIRLQQRAAEIRSQRAAREQENARNLGDLASALADPIPARGVIVPEPPPPNPFARKPQAPSASALAADRLARLAAENGDVAVLKARLEALEDRLAAARAEALALKRDMNATVRDLNAYGDTVRAAVEDARERGASMALDGLLTLEPKALAQLGEVQSNSRAWNRLTGILQDTDQGAHAVIDASQKLDERLEDARQLLARRDLKEDVTFLAKRLGGRYYETGSSILASAQNIRDELDAWRHIDADNLHVGGAPARLAKVQADLQGLQGDLRSAREATSRATGIPAKDLVRAPPEPKGPGLGGFAVPNPND